jgi:hypothetical protein
MKLLISRIFALKWAAVFLFVAATGITNLSSQVNSPYSRYGLGNIFPATFAASNGMGGLSAAYFSPLNINYYNPSSYADLSYATFEVGAYANFLTLQTTDDNFTSGNANLSNIAMGFPFLKKLRTQKFGLSFGLIPFSAFQYNIQEDVITEDTLFGTESYNYRGEGTLYQFYGGLGYRITIDSTNIFSLGANAAHLFGTLKNTTIASFPSQPNSQNTRLERTDKMAGLLLNYGIGYQKQIVKEENEDKNYFVYRVGGSFSPALDIKGTQSVLWTNVSPFGFITDTLYSSPDTSGNITLPPIYKAGVSFSFFSTEENKNQFTIGAEYSATEWSMFRGIETAGEVNNTWRTSLGVEFIPKPGDAKKRSATLRAGGYYGLSYLVINGVQLSDYGATAGVGIPIGFGSQTGQSQSLSRLNLAVNIGQRGDVDVIKETYFNFSIGFTLIDTQWFQRYKLN